MLMQTILLMIIIMIALIIRSIESQGTLMELMSIEFDFCQKLTLTINMR